MSHQNENEDIETSRVDSISSEFLLGSGLVDQLVFGGVVAVIVNVLIERALQLRYVDVDVDGMVGHSTLMVIMFDVLLAHVSGMIDPMVVIYALLEMDQFPLNIGMTVQVKLIDHVPHTGIFSTVHLTYVSPDPFVQVVYA